MPGFTLVAIEAGAEAFLPAPGSSPLLSGPLAFGVFLPLTE